MSDYTPDETEVATVWQAQYGDGDAGVGKTLRREGEESWVRFIADVKADAWDEGLQAGWEECQNPDPFVNDWWDSKAPNPHRIESGASNE